MSSIARTVAGVTAVVVAAAATYRRALDDKHDDKPGRLWRRHGSSRIYAGLDRHDSPLEAEVSTDLRSRFPFHHNPSPQPVRN